MTPLIDMTQPRADHRPDRCRTVADVAERLMAKYEPSVPLALISDTVRAAAHRLARTGGSNPAAEAVLRAADRRLARLATAS